MAKKPVNFTVKNAKQAADRLNEFVEQGGYEFDIGVSTEYVKTVTVNSDGTKQESKEPVYRIMGFANLKEGKELEAYTSVKKEREELKKQRDSMNRTLSLLNGKAFGPLSVFLLCVGIFTLLLGSLTLFKVLPLPEGQTPIAVVLTIVGLLAIAGSIVASKFRGNKIKLLQKDRASIEAENNKLMEAESKVDAKTPSWYINAVWSFKGNTVYNALQEIIIK